MKKQKLLHYWGSVDAVTKVVKGETKDNEWGKKHTISFTAQKIGCDEVVVYNCEKETIVAINGSDGDKKEWRGNFQGYPITDGCHYNFRKDGIRILESVIRDCPKDKKLVVVGHSRGGALAQIFSHYAGRKHRRKTFCVTFGSPRCFTWRKTSSLTFSHARVHTDGDPVCHIPPVWLPPFFKSYQTENVRIRPKRILGIRKKHGMYNEMIEKYMK
jgi:hypothetical protein